MANSKPPYPAQFKEEAVLPTRTSGKPPAQIARDLGVSLESIRHWIKRAQIDAGAQDGLTTEEQGELRRLRRENHTMRQEREVLKNHTRFPLEPGRCVAGFPISA